MTDHILASTIFITGPGGNVGAELTRALIRKGIRPRLGGQTTERIRQIFGDQAEIVRFDFANPETFGPALSGVKKMFLMRPPAISDVKRYLFPVIDAARQAEVEQIVFLSLIGVEKNRFVPHYQVEQYLKASDIAYTFLRPSFFMQNLSTTHREEIRDENLICVPSGRGTTSFIDVRDIAAVAALALTEPGHDNRAYELTGSQALDYYQVAALLSQRLGRKITYTNPNILTFIQRQLRKKIPLQFALIMAVLYTVSSLGQAGTLTAETTRLLHREPISIQQFINDYHDCWNPESKA